METKGLRAGFVQEHVHVLQCYNANRLEETARLDAEELRVCRKKSNFNPHLPK